MVEIDEVIGQHGGWPGAFQPGKNEIETTTQYSVGADLPRRTRFRDIS